MQSLEGFLYFEPKTLEEATEILTENGIGTHPLAGGTDLLVRMKKGDVVPSALVNLKQIKDLDQIRKEAGKGTQVGSLVLLSTIEDSAIIRSGHPVLAQAAGIVGSRSIRNLGTLGGNIGRASPASDLAPSLMVLKARVTIEGAQGTRREVNLEEIFSGPGTTTLSPGELIISFFLPELSPYSGSVYLKLGRRQGMDCALIGVAVFLRVGKKYTEAKDARIALGAVAPTPIRAKKAEEVLMSGSLSEKLIKEAARVAAEESSPMDDMRASRFYRIEMVKVLTFRAILSALDIAQGATIK